jgi:4-hydroxy-3-methylbut-2-en-1-yl diphosphate reductase
VVSSAAEAQVLPAHRRYGLIAQTTQSLENLQQVASALLTRAHALKVFNTICNATTDLQHETRELAKRVDLMLVVGGRNSANTARLAVICEMVGVRTHHIEDADEISAAWLQDVGTVGVTAGTSTPDRVIASVIQRLQALGGEP